MFVCVPSLVSLTAVVKAKRQQRKLNFLITQTELYAHFMAKKLTGMSCSLLLNPGAVCVCVCVCCVCECMYVCVCVYTCVCVGLG